MTEKLTSDDALEVLRELSQDKSLAMTEADVLRQHLRDAALEHVEHEQECLALAANLLRDIVHHIRQCPPSTWPHNFLSRADVLLKKLDKQS